MTDLTGLARAVEAAGSITALARKLGVAHQVANRWVHRGYVPAARALEIEVIYGIPARDLVKPSLLEIANLILP
jgi:DNA-binding transcriptional regulator YdaS (Cro superfamily)